LAVVPSKWVRLVGRYNALAKASPLMGNFLFIRTMMGNNDHDGVSLFIGGIVKEYFLFIWLRLVR
jgi:hypothetical protein